MKWPTDRKFTDKDGKILDHWRGPMGVLEPFLALTPQEQAGLLAMVRAFLNPDDETDPGTAINLALPIDDEPLAAEDWLIEYKNSAQAGRRVPISTLLALAPSKTFISSTSLSGSSDLIIPIPVGYTDIEMRINALSTSSNVNPTLNYSEDGGSTFVNQPGAATTSSLVARNTTTYPNMLPGAMNAADVMYAVETVRDYLSLTTKLAILEGSYAGEYMFRGVNIQSTAPLNAAHFSVSAGTFDGGTVDLFGIP